MHRSRWRKSCREESWQTVRLQRVCQGNQSKCNATLETWAENGRIEWLKRSYEPGDVVNAWLVFAATSDKQVNRLVWVEAEEAGRLANICDSRDLCSFIVPASIRHGTLQVAISTSGTNPAAAGGLRQILESDLRDGTTYFQQEITKFDD